MTPSLQMQVRNVDVQQRTVEGVCVPWDEVSYLTPFKGGERVLRGAFTKSVAQRSVFLYREHDHAHPVGRSKRFTDTAAGLVGEFVLRESVLGDETLADLREDYLPAMSIGFRALQARQAPDGVMEVVEAQLLEVSLVSLPAYEGARVLALRREAEAAAEYPAPRFDHVDLSTVPPAWLYG